MLRVGVGLWFSAVVGGFAAWETYDATAGPAPVGRPAATLPRADGRWSLVVFAHPRCPCTAATLTELAELARGLPVPMDIRVVFVRPAGRPAGWEQTPLWATAAAIPGVRVECDPGGEQARAAGATTSGSVVLYGPGGEVAFRGGITRGRGKVGESLGRGAITDLVAGREPPIRDAPVFGCPLLGAASCSGEEKTECRP